MKETASKGETMFRRQAVKRKIWELEQKVDRAWAAKVDALIPAAEKVAASVVANFVALEPGENAEQRDAMWNEVFHLTMHEMAHNKKLRSWK
jgi:hypothetical protein